jgi:hypothetical protein
MTTDKRRRFDPRAPRRDAFVERLRDMLRGPLGANRPAVTAGPPAQSQRGRSGDPPTCDVCHRRLLSGEQVTAYGRGEQLLLACQHCGIELCSAGLRRQPAGADGQNPLGASGAERAA